MTEVQNIVLLYIMELFFRMIEAIFDG